MEKFDYEKACRFDVQATLDAIRMLRDRTMAPIADLDPIGRHILVGAYIRLEDELRAYYTGNKG